MSAFQRVCVAPNPTNAVDPSGDVVPTGIITYWGSATVPEDWLLCNGAAVSRTGYSDLFELFGTAFGNGNGTPVAISAGSIVSGNAVYTVASLDGFTAGAQFVVAGTGNALWNGTFLCASTLTSPNRVLAVATTQTGTISTGTIVPFAPTTFNLPNLNGRVVRALGQATAPAPNVGFIGATGGADSASFTIAAANLPPHRHGVLVPGTAMASGTNGGGFPNVDNGTRTIANSTFLEDGVTPVANSAISLGITNQYFGLNFAIKT